MIPMERKFLLEVMQEIWEEVAILEGTPEVAMTILPAMVIIPVRLAMVRVHARHVGAMVLLTVIIPEAAWYALTTDQMWVNAQCVAELAKNMVSNDNSSYDK